MRAKRFRKLGPLMSSRWLACICLPMTLSALAEKLPDPVTAGWQGETVCEVLREDAELRIFRCTFPPGVGHERHFHPRHFGYALSGGTMRITSESGTREVTLKTGSYFFSEGITWHEGLNVGDTTVSYLMIEPKSP
jgi:quercetin dioxygenase-like cupin family protein